MFTVRIEGTSCQHCVQSVRGVLSSFDGVEIGRIQPCRAQVLCDPGDMGIDAMRDTICDAIRDEGFTAVVVTSAAGMMPADAAAP